MSSNSNDAASGSGAVERVRRTRGRPDDWDDYVHGEEFDEATRLPPAKRRFTKAEAATRWYLTKNNKSTTCYHVHLTEAEYVLDDTKVTTLQPSKGPNTSVWLHSIAADAGYFGVIGDYEWGKRPTDYGDFLPAFEVPPALLYMSAHLIYGQMIATKHRPSSLYKAQAVLNGFTLEVFLAMFPQATLEKPFRSHSRYTTTFKTFVEFSSQLAEVGGWTELDFKGVESPEDDPDKLRLDVTWNERDGTYNRGPVVVTWCGTHLPIRPMKEQYKDVSGAFQSTLTISWVKREMAPSVRKADPLATLPIA